MDVREKLIDLLTGYSIDTQPDVEYVADHLISNGVTVHDWIPVTGRLPELPSGSRCQVMVNTCSKGDKRSRPMFYERAVIRGKTVERWLYHWDRIADKDPDYWMPLPQPPKGE